MTSRLTAIYHVRSDAHSIAARAQAIAVEQSVEMPLSAIEDQSVLDEIVGKVEDIGEIVPGLFAVRIGLAASTIGDDAGQLINMLFGNVSLQDDVILHDAEIPDDLAAQWRGPAYGLRGIRQRTGIEGRAFTCAALKPQGLPPEQLGELAARLARGGVDFIKDDHGLAEPELFAVRGAHRSGRRRAAQGRARDRPPRALCPEYHRNHEYRDAPHGRGTQISGSKISCFSR